MLAYLKFTCSVRPTVCFVKSLGLAYNSTTSLVFLVMEVLILIFLLMFNDIVEGTSQTNDRKC